MYAVKVMHVTKLHKYGDESTITEKFWADTFEEDIENWLKPYKRYEITKEWVEETETLYVYIDLTHTIKKVRA